MPARSQACATTSRSAPIPPNGPTNELVTAVSSRSAITRATSSCFAGSGVTHTPGVGEPSPAQASRVRSRCRSCRRDSGTLTSSTSHRPSHAVVRVPKP